MGKLSHINTHPKRIDELLEMETYPDYVRDDANYFRYRRGVSIAQKFEDAGLWEIDFDDSDVKYGIHQINVRVKENYFGREMYQEFVNFVRQFDNMMFLGEPDGTTVFVVSVGEVYKPTSVQGK